MLVTLWEIGTSMEEVGGKEGRWKWEKQWNKSDITFLCLHMNTQPV